MRLFSLIAVFTMLLAPVAQADTTLPTPADANPEVKTGAPPAGHGQADPHAAPAEPGKQPIAGKAAEVFTSGGYTYVRVEREGVSKWVAVPAMTIATGDKVSFQPGEEMPNFESRSLNKVFDSITFSGGPTAPPAVEAPRARVAVSGKAVEVLHSGGYTYVNVEKAGKTNWVAVPAMKVTTGSKVSFALGDEIPDFSSKTLNRTFGSVIFSPGPAGTQPGKQQKAPGTGGATAADHGKVAVEKAAGANAYTVAEIHKLKGTLDKKKVTVRGKVVKVSSGIMNRNWIHLKDGTGNSKKKTDSLVVTSDALPADGAIVTITGTLAKDRDFGSGYKYQAIVEKAEIRGN